MTLRGMDVREWSGEVSPYCSQGTVGASGLRPGIEVASAVCIRRDAPSAARCRWAIPFASRGSITAIRGRGRSARDERPVACHRSISPTMAWMSRLALPQERQTAAQRGAAPRMLIGWHRDCAAESLGRNHLGLARDRLGRSMVILDSRN